MKNSVLDQGYTIREMNEEEFFIHQKPLREKVFAKDHSIFPFQYLDEEEKKQIQTLGGQLYHDRYKLYLGIFDKEDHFVGWHFGFQESAHVFYMCNSAILEPHRRKGLYAALLDYSLKVLTEKGFQVVYSRHNATNNPVIIPKLKAGFVITSLEMDDVFGVLVHLKYFTNKTRRKILDYRSGQSRPDKELSKLFS